jgi:recombination protein RecA
MGVNMSDKKLEAFFKGYSEAEDELEFRMASDVFGEKVPVISTGSPGLDDALSSGGLPKGRIIQYYGPSGSGKSFCSMIAILQAQKETSTVKQLFIDVEGTFDPTWANQLGIDLSRVIIVDEDLAVNGRRCFEMLLGTPKEDKQHILVGKSKLGFLDNIREGSLEVNLIVLDSLGAIIPPIEDTAAIGKSNMSPLARFLTTTMKKLSLEVKKAKVPFIIINHKRDNMDPYGADHTFAGGNSYTHFLSANVYFEAIQRKDSQILDDKEQKIGHPIRAKVEKSKFGPWPRQCEFKIDFTKGIIDTHEEIAQLALNYNIVEKPTSVTHQYGENKWVGFGKYCDALKENSELCSELLTKIEQTRDIKRDAARSIQSKSSESIEEQDSKKKKG